MPVAVIPSQFQPEETETPAEREQRTVHDVYESIAPHFSATRYKPWPIISRFLANVPPNSIGLDSGAGNGKYLPVLRASSPGSIMLALDRSLGLLEIARTQKGGVGEQSTGSSSDMQKGKGREKVISQDMEAVQLDHAQTVLEECLRGDLCFNGWRDDIFDFAISIAAVHHLSTPARRMESVRSLIRPLRLTPPTISAKESQPRGSRFLIYVWAFEQGENSKRKMGVLASMTQPTQANQESEKQHSTADKNSIGETTSKEGIIAQDVMVPWVLQPKVQPKTKNPKKQEKKSRGPRGKGVPDAATGTAASGTQEQATTTLPRTPGVAIEESGQADFATPAAPQVFHRYYHLFVKGELKDLVEDAGRAEGFTIVQQQPAKSNSPQDSGLPSDATLLADGSGAPGKWLRIVEEGYEKDNWWLEGEVGLYLS
ncbi:hypothetical protein QFC21_000674 [Naganishia friedmannii]|uniref:Uncharacterized protein n=1 Tax=Naganishia friedmannii TaxID=89922 RepID=A0ACC2WC60_9TREE|nr:hypothetical protein QFC21_000674 [Naganishia friedmannii]